MTARAPIPAAIRFEYTAPEGATVRCPGHPSCPHPHDLQVVDVELIWEPRLTAKHFLGFDYSFRLTGEHPTCEIHVNYPTEPWMENMARDSYPLIQAVENAICPPGQKTCRLREAPWLR